VEEVHIAREVAEQTEEVCVPGKRVTERALLVKVMPTNALRRQIEAVAILAPQELVIPPECSPERFGSF
jgi:hypothetical protein